MIRRLGFCFFVATRQLRVRWRSTLLTLLGVSVAVFAAVVMYSMMRGFQAQMIEQILAATPHLTMRGRERGDERTGRVYESTPELLVGYTRLRPRERARGIQNYAALIERVQATPGIRAAAPVVSGSALLSFGTTRRRATIHGTLPERYAEVTLIREQIRSGTLEDLQQRSDGVILGELLARDLGVGPGDRVRALASSGEWRDLRVVALYYSGITAIDRVSAFVNLRMAQQLHDYPGRATTLVFQVESVDAAAPLARRVEALTGYETLSWQEANANFFAIFQRQNSITGAVILMTLIVAGGGIANALVTLVLEKKRDIGILKAMGVPERLLTTIFVIEGALIGIAGTLFGVPIGALIVEKMSRTPFPGGQGGAIYADTFVMLQTADVYWAPALFAVGIAILASYLPSRRASKYDPVEIIRTAK